MRRRLVFDFISAFWTQSFVRQVGHLLFCIGAVRFIYEVRLSYNGIGWSAFFQSPRASSGGAG